MTGPEHYKQAERLLAAADQVSRYLAGLGGQVSTSQQKEIDAGETAMLTVAARAQVHATLALAAATVMAGCDMGATDWEAWRATASEHKPGGARDAG